MQADTLLPTRSDEHFASTVAARYYGLSTEARTLPGEYDDNFHLTAKDGRQFVLKIMHPSRVRAFVEMQAGALQHLATHAPQLAMPRVCPTVDGDPIVTCRDHQGAERIAWLLTYIEGRTFAETRPHSQALLRDLGSFLGQLDRGLADYEHPAAERDFKWASERAPWILEHLDSIADPHCRRLVEKLMAPFQSETLPRLKELPRSLIHADANDYNVLTRAAPAAAPVIAGLIDFGDMHYAARVCEPAIAAAYALLHKPDPLTAAAQLIAGYHKVSSLSEAEIAVLFPLILARLCVSVVNSAQRKSLAPDDPYITISEAPAWAALERLATVSPRLAHYTFRQACGLPGVPRAGRVVEWLRAQPAFSPVMDGLDNTRLIDLGVASTWTGADPQAVDTALLSERIERELSAAGSAIGVGPYQEIRAMYTAPQFSGGNVYAEGRSLHLGLDLFAPSGSPVRAPLDGTVRAFADNATAGDYGPVIILEHQTSQGDAFFTLYGHLSRGSLKGMAIGRRVAAGEQIATLGSAAENGGWPPHLHLQIITDLLDRDTDFPGVARPSERELWASLSPDPNLIARLPDERASATAPPIERAIEQRRARLGANLSVSYRSPLKIVRGWKQHLYDDRGRTYLDVYNNVPLVGHSHPRIVRAVQEQIGLLNTNTRYLHDNILRYAERLTAHMPAPLRVCYFLNSASEANELALRLARTHSGFEDVIVLDHAYHGHTTSLIDISPYKFNGPGGSGRKPWVHVAELADDYRGPHKRNDPQVGAKYAESVAEIIHGGVRPAAFIAESLPSVGGQIVFPSGYLEKVYASVRRAGGLCIADEVQVGFGRLGSHFWGFETQGVVPDIVVLGKPIGNAFPLAALVTTPEIAASFDNGMEFFSTFGGNPVACAAGLAVLDVLRDEELPQNAKRVGAVLKQGLESLMQRSPLVGDVRGMGLFLGVELVRDRTTLEPAAEEASYIVNRLREEGILAGTDGPLHNVIKLRPPLCLPESDAAWLVEKLGAILEEDALRHVR